MTIPVTIPCPSHAHPRVHAGCSLRGLPEWKLRRLLGARGPVCIGVVGSSCMARRRSRSQLRPEAEWQREAGARLCQRHDQCWFGPRPKLCKGQWFVAKWGYTKIRCKSYDAPPSTRECHIIRVWHRGEYIGPVSDYENTDRFATIRVGDEWINVWCRDQWDVHYGATPPSMGVHYAMAVPERVVDEWHAAGWCD